MSRFNKKVIIKLIALTVILFSCNNTKPDLKEKSEIKSVNSSPKKFIDITKETFNGDVKSYQELRNMYLDSFPGDFLFWAMLMANRHNYPEAYLDVFHCIVNSYVGEIDKFEELDSRTKLMALEYINKAAELNVSDAKILLKKLSPRSARSD